ncbi:O-antigen ligase family protein [Candidatus Gottesmanbacteria bacterium]|nr:O-antigen ligase family protein [Candidatus Gottesmanbacteria bacterium]
MIHQVFFSLLLIFLPTQLGYHFWPEWAMVLGRRVDYLAPTIYLTDILVGLTIFFWGLESVNRIMKYELGIMVRIHKVTSFVIHNSRFIILLLALVVINIFVATNRPVAVYKWLKAGEFVLLGWYIVRTKPKLSAISFQLSVGVLYSSILAIAQFFFQHSIGGPLWWLGERTFAADTPGIARYDFNVSLFTFHFSLFGLRPYATFPHPNVLGGFLAATLPLLLMSLMRPMGPMSQIKKRMYVIVLTAGVIALILTFSRSAMVMGGAAIAVAIANIKNQKSKIKNTDQKSKRVKQIIFVGIAIAIVYLLSSVFHLQILQRGEESVVVRQQLNNAATKLWTSSPLFGVGLGNFLVRLPEVLPSRTIYFLQPVHNIYLLLLSEIGIVGIGLIVFLIANLLNHESGIMKHGKDKTKFIIHTSLFIILLLGLFDHYPLTLQQGQLLLTVLAGMSLTFVH